MDMAEVEADDPGAGGGGHGERVLPVTGRERERGTPGPGSPSVHSFRTDRSDRQGIHPAANRKERDTDVALK